jgi:hypothetical protein
MYCGFFNNPDLTPLSLSHKIFRIKSGPLKTIAHMLLFFPNPIFICMRSISFSHSLDIYIYIKLGSLKRSACSLPLSIIVHLKSFECKWNPESIK